MLTHTCNPSTWKAETTKGRRICSKLETSLGYTVSPG